MDKNKKWWLPLVVGAGLGIASGVVVGKAFEPSKEELEKQLNEMTQQNMKKWEEEMAEIMKELESKKDAQFLMNQYTKLNTLLTQSKEEDANQTEILKEMETIETLVMVNPKVTTEDKETFRKYLLDCESNVFKEFGSQSVDRLFRYVYVKASGKQVFNGREEKGVAICENTTQDFVAKSDSTALYQTNENYEYVENDKYYHGTDEETIELKNDLKKLFNQSVVPSSYYDVVDISYNQKDTFVISCEYKDAYSGTSTTTFTLDETGFISQMNIESDRTYDPTKTRTTESCFYTFNPTNSQEFNNLKTSVLEDIEKCKSKYTEIIR